MTGRKRKDKKKRCERDENFEDSKRINTQNAPEGPGSISQVLGEANSVLYHEGISVSTSNAFDVLSCVCDSDTNAEGINEGFYGNTIHTSNVQSNVSDVNQFAEPKLPKTMEGKTIQHNMGPTHADIIAMLGKIDLKLNDMDARLKTLEGPEKKIDNFDKDLKKLWAHMNTVTKDTRDNVDRVENKIDSVGVDIERARRKILDLEKDNSKLREDMNYVQSQSMRNNLIFGNIPEVSNETPIKCEQLVRDFMLEKLKLSREAVAAMKFDRVHRMGHKNTTSRGTTGRDYNRVINPTLVIIEASPY
ncbi:hypothetical protein DPMN_169729 [Dreissena polymorpha]|uniref:Uncharacterized protein n=1 Tax=Dreissena polymorpha TaxID=45954 RepID=A0A9D4IC92_DREPO|nr:hypothetical protein DPMN_169729 [Dreissena polymorpha]